MAKFTKEFNYNEKYGYDNYDIEIEREYSPYDLRICVGADIDEYHRYTFWYEEVINDSTSDIVLNFPCGEELIVPANCYLTLGDFRYPITDYLINEDFNIKFVKAEKARPFCYLGKEKMLQILKEQLNNPNIEFTDIMYKIEEDFARTRTETLVYCNDGMHYKVINMCCEFTKETKLIYQVVKRNEENNYTELENVELKRK